MALDKFKKQLTSKQFDTLVRWIDKKPRITLLSGGKRSGKSYLLALMFLIMVKRFKGQNQQFSILGATISTVNRNIIPLLEMWIGKKIKIGKYNDFELYGNRVTIFGAGDIGSLESIRGNTVAGVLINECSMLEEENIKEAMDRCSVEGAQIIIDTNPTSFYEYTYTDIISKGDLFDEDGRMVQMCVHFTMLDNTTLPKEYINQQLMRYAVGTVDYERHILGKYANKEGLIYYMFNETRHIIKAMPTDCGVSHYFMAQDFGFGANHSGSLSVIAKLRDGRFIVVAATVEENQGIDFWRERAREYRDKFGAGRIYADYARPDLMAEMRKDRFEVLNADKSVLLGIDRVSSYLSEDKLFFLDTLPKICFEEFARYSWATGGKEAPKKEFDNFLDGIRYGLMSEHKIAEVKTTYSNFKGGMNYSKFRH